MKHLITKIRILLVCITALLLLPSRSYCQMSGNYTINPTQSAGGTNYTSWSSAISDLVSQGINGPVTFTVREQVYSSTTISIPAISGSSYSNRITFKSATGDSSKCKLVWPIGSGKNQNDWVLRLDGADYITFKGIGFERSGSLSNVLDSATVVRIGNSIGTVTSVNCWFQNCYFRGDRRPSTQTTKGFSGGMAPIGSCIFIESYGCDSTRLENNRFLYGYNSVYNNAGGIGNYIAYNLCDTPGSAGIYCSSHTGPRIIGNRINIGDFGTGWGYKHYTSYALRMDNCNNITVAGNRAISTAVNADVGRTVVFTYATGSRNMVYNNTVSNTGATLNCNGIAVLDCSNLYIISNNILVTSSLTDGVALHFYPDAQSVASPNCNIINNNLINKGAGYAINAQSEVAKFSSIDTFDYNNLYSAGTYIAAWDTSGPNWTKRTSLSALKAYSGKCANCLSLDPGFISNSDLHVSSIAINGKAIPDPRITIDMDNETRHTTTPDIGADEFFPVTTDAGISVIDSPAYFCAGTRNVKVKFQNYGIDPLTKLSIGWSVNGVAQTGISWTGTVASGISSPSLSLGSYTFASNTAYDFKIWTSNPNGAPDGKPLNDTLKETRSPAMTGNYTIGDTTAADYKSFNTAITAIAERGMCGAVNMNVFNGTFKEQIGITPLPGMGVNSPLTFQSISKDSSKVLLSLPANTAQGSNNAMVQLRGCSYVTFRGITFERTTSTGTYAQNIHIISGSHHNTFENCQMLGVQGTTSVTAHNIWSEQSQDNNNVFRKNYIKWGNASVLYTNTSSTAREVGNVFENNVIEGGVINAIQASYNDGITVKGNTFLNGFTSTNSDILLKDCDSNINVSGNYFKSTNTSTSMVISACHASAWNPGIISNNSIVRATGTGILLDTTTNMKVVYNSANFTGTGTNSAISTTGNSTNTTISNNNIVMQTGEAMHITYGSEVSASDHNNLLTKGVDFVYYGGVFGNMTDLTNTTGTNANSISIDPFFKSGSDLHIKNPLMKGAGIPIAEVTTDIDGEARHSTTPDIGADEFELSPDDAGIIELVNPIAGTCAGTLPIEIVIRNFGKDTLKSAIIYWSAVNIAKTPYMWTGKLATGQRDTFVIGTFNFLTALNPRFGFGSNMPNGKPDGISFNDSFTTNRSLRALPAANAGPDKTICDGDTLNIGPNPIVGLSYKWLTMSGIVLVTTSKINVKPGVQTPYILEVTNTTFGCSRRDTVTINVNPAVVANAGTNKAICPGSAAQLGATTQSGFTYSWTSLPSGFASSIANPSVSPTQTTNYFLVKTNSSTGCKGMDTVVVDFSPVPSSNITGLTSTCIGSVTTYTTTGASGNSYNWSVTGGSISSGQNTNSIDVLWNTSGSGAVDLIETNASTCKDTAASFNVLVSSKPIAKFGVSKTCLGDATIFTDSSTDALIYKWDFDDGATSILKDPNHTYGSAIIYTPKLIVESSFGCMDTITRPVIVNPLPVPDFTFFRQPNRTYDFNDISSVSGGTITAWKWHFGDGDSSSLQKPSHHYQPGDFVITLCVQSSGGCKKCITQNLNVVGLDELASDKNLYIMPNPGSGLFTVTSNTTMASIVVTNAMGQVVETITPLNTEMKIDLTSQPAGIYFIRVNMDGQSRVLKLIKQ